MGVRELLGGAGKKKSPHIGIECRIVHTILPFKLPHFFHKYLQSQRHQTHMHMPAVLIRKKLRGQKQVQLMGLKQLLGFELHCFYSPNSFGVITSHDLGK